MKNPTLFLSNISIGISLIACLYYWKYLDSVFRLLTLQIALALAAQIVGIVFNNRYNNNTVIFNVYLFFDLWLVGSVGFLMIKKKLFKNLLLAGIVICTFIDVMCIWNTGFNTFANWGNISASILFTITFLFIFVGMLFNNESASLTKSPRFWVCMAILIYHGSTVPIFGFFHYLIEYHRSVAAKIVYVNDILSVVRYSFICVAIILMRNQKRNSLTAKPAAP